MRIAELARWRWTPTFALVGGSIAFVLVVVAVVPDTLEGGVASTPASATRLAKIDPPQKEGSEPKDAAEAPKKPGRFAPPGMSQLPGGWRPGARPPSAADQRVESLFAPNPVLPAPLPDDPPPPEAIPAVPVQTAEPPVQGTAPSEPAVPQ